MQSNIFSLLDFVLTHNYFVFKDRFYHQVNGTAMGTNCAPTYANLFLGWWEERIAFMEEYENYNSHILFWGRYNDDVLILGTYIFLLNSNSIGMKFKY